MRRENLNELESNGLFTKRSAFGYSSRMFSMIDGPVSSNRRAPPTKHTAILAVFGEAAAAAAEKKVGMRRRRAAEGVVAEGEMEKNRRREKEVKMKRRNLQSRSVTHFVMGIAFLGLPCSIFANNQTN